MHPAPVSMDHLWLPFTPNRQFQQAPRVMVGADGMHFTTQQGQQVLDGISSLWCVVAGHNVKPINEAIHQQLGRLDYATAFQFGTDRAFEAAQRIAELAPGDLNKVLFCSSGSEAADTAMKLALAYHRARGQGHRQVFIGRERGYHGVGLGGMSIGGIPGNRKVFGAAMLSRVDHMRFIHDPVHHAYVQNELPVWEEDPLLDLEQRILPLHDPSNVAAIFVEPVAGSAGWYIPPQGYLQRLRQICDKHGILLVFDEVITGFGRVGTPFAANLLRRGSRHDQLCQRGHQWRHSLGRRDLSRWHSRGHDEHRCTSPCHRVFTRLHLLRSPCGLCCRGGHPGLVPRRRLVRPRRTDGPAVG